MGNCFRKNDLDDSFQEMVYKKDSGISYVEEEESYAVQFFNPVGDMEELYFRTLSELFHSVTSVRFVKLENRIMPKKMIQNYNVRHTSHLDDMSQQRTRTAIL